MDQQNNTENTQTPKQQVVERVKAATNVLVTVSTDPTVDQLSAAIGLTLMLNKLGKHATAVFSGKVPSTIEFLKPGETIEANTDSLRDFIVSLDKSKADKLRYKVEENVVRIYITPYRTSISEKDLEFTQGDFNVDVVLALGVKERENLDQAIVSHGRILHDATVITVSAGQSSSELGNINWQEAGASSLSEMIVSISEAFQGGLIDGQMATAFLTGIVAETERFRNPKTTPKVMTMSAQLMAAGANQQLIASELEKADMLPESTPVSVPHEAPKEPAAKSADGSLEIEHNAPEPVAPPEENSEIHIDNDGTLMMKSDVEPDNKGTNNDGNPRHRVIEPLNQAPKPEGPKTDLKKFSFDVPDNVPPFSSNMPEQKPEESFNPLMPAGPEDLGSELPALQPQPAPTPAPEPAPMPQPPTPTPAPAPLPSVPTFQLPPEPAPAPAPAPEPAFVPAPEPSPVLDPMPAPSPLPPSVDPVDSSDTLLEIEKSVHSPHLQDGGGVDSARNAVEDAINALPYDPAHPEPLQALNATPLDQLQGQAAAAHVLSPEFPPLPGGGAPEPASTQNAYPLPDPADMFASHNTGMPELPVPEQADQPAPQIPGGMPLHSLGETLPEPQQDDDDGMLPPPVPPPMMPAS